MPLAAKTIQEGAFGFIEKPMDESILVNAVEAAIKQGAKVEELTGKLLTNSETMILQLISEGKSNSEMAYMLHRSIGTIERHRDRLMKKLNAGNSAELTKVALALGLTSPQIE
ncbi:MAG: response regulator transcription factor [Planctomycetes bacterium]|nr:response regulator transcription factor [Planctomycetota bacterium]